MPEYRKVDITQLSKADIIFTTSNSPTSATIRKATNSIISHTMLVTGFQQVIEAVDSGVEERPWKIALEHSEATIAIVMRRKGLISGVDQDKVVARRSNIQRSAL